MKGSAGKIKEFLVLFILFSSCRLRRAHLHFVRLSRTEGELRSRASRMEDISDIETLRTILKPLTQRAMVAELQGQMKTLAEALRALKEALGA